MDYVMKKTLQEIFPEMMKIRHQIHANPELAYKENATAELIAATLQKYHYEVTTKIAGTGVSALLDSGKPGKTVALRADMDALPIKEETFLPYQSRNANVMHACGHDGHVATLLAAAAALQECKELFKGKIKFIFQPAEEIGSGALGMIKAGILEDPKVDAIFGYHNTPTAPLGVVVARKGCMLAASDLFTIHIKGKGGHAAHPNTTTNPIYLGSSIIETIQSNVRQIVPPTEAVVVSITEFKAGSAYNIIPEEAVLRGTIRTISADTQKKVKQRLTEIVSGIAGALGGTATINFDFSFPPTVNYTKETELVIATVEQMLGKEKVIIKEFSSMAAEDFAYYLEKIPGCFFFVGTNLPEKAIHSPHFEFNDEIIPIAAEVLGAVAMEYLNQH